MNLIRLATAALAVATGLFGSEVAKAQYFKSNNVGQPFQSKPAPAPPPPAPQPVIQQFKAANSPAPIAGGALPAPGASGIAGSTQAIKPIAPVQNFVAPQQTYVTPQPAPVAPQFRAATVPQPLSTNVYPPAGSSGVSGSTQTMLPANPSRGQPTRSNGYVANTPSTPSPSYTGTTVVPAYPSSVFQGSGVSGSTPSIVGVVLPPTPGRPNFVAAGPIVPPPSQTQLTLPAKAPIPSTTFANSGVANSTPAAMPGAQGNRPSFSGVAPATTATVASSAMIASGTQPARMAPLDSAQGAALRSNQPVPPLGTSAVITQEFDQKWSENPTKDHTGIDIAYPGGVNANKGKPVAATFGGKVVEVGQVDRSNPAWGQFVTVQDSSGSYSTYMHVNSFVQPGATVVPGQQIATIYNDHLHFNQCTQEAACRRGAAVPPSGAIDPRYPNDPRINSGVWENPDTLFPQYRRAPGAAPG